MYEACRYCGAPEGRYQLKAGGACCGDCIAPRIFTTVESPTTDIQRPTTDLALSKESVASRLYWRVIDRKGRSLDLINEIDQAIKDAEKQAFDQMDQYFEKLKQPYRQRIGTLELEQSLLLQAIKQAVAHLSYGVPSIAHGTALRLLTDVVAQVEERP